MVKLTKTLIILEVSLKFVGVILAFVNSLFNGKVCCFVASHQHLSFESTSAPRTCQNSLELFEERRSHNHLQFLIRYIKNK
jgi:hypothetical protein